jgi:hypothetical protein
MAYREAPSIVEVSEESNEGGGIIDSEMDPLAAMTCAGDTNLYVQRPGSVVRL